MQELSVKSANLPNETKRFTDGLFVNCSKLRKLDIQNTPISQEMMELVIKGIHLKDFTMRYCEVDKLPDNFIYLAQQLVRLDLSHNHLRYVFL